MTARRVAALAVEPATVDEKSGDKRHAIVVAARELFTTVGYEDTTMAEVARRAGVAVGTIYLYFKNKQELLFAVKEAWEQEIFDFMARPELQALPFHQRARPLIQGFFELCTQQTSMVQMMGLQPQEVGNFHPKDRTMIPAVQRLLEDGIAAGAFRPMDTEIAATLAFALVEEGLMQCFVVGDGSDQERYINTLVDTLEHWLLMPEFLDK